eukprot:7018853-Alexandrium_andersonii.AAC.1
MEASILECTEKVDGVLKSTEEKAALDELFVKTREAWGTLKQKADQACDGWAARVVDVSSDLGEGKKAIDVEMLAFMQKAKFNAEAASFGDLVKQIAAKSGELLKACLLYTSPSPRD